MAENHNDSVLPPEEMNDESQTEGTQGTGSEPTQEEILASMTPEERAEYWRNQTIEIARNKDRGFQKYKEEKEREIEEARLASLRTNVSIDDSTEPTDIREVYPNFDYLSPEDQEVAKNNYARLLRTVTGFVMNQPHIKQSAKMYAIQQASQVFDQVVTLPGYEALAPFKDEFIAKYPLDKHGEIPSNAFELYQQLADMFLMGKTRAGEVLIEQPKAPERIELHRGNGGQKSPAAEMTLRDAEQLASRDPQKYAQLVREGKIDPSKLK